MRHNDHIPVLTDLIEKGIKIELSGLGLDHDQDLILETDGREEPKFENTTQPEFKPASSQSALSDNPALEQTIRRILDEHMELALQEIKLAIEKIEKESTN